MNDYITLLNRFWQHNEEKPLGAGITAFYLFLLSIWKEKGNDFTLSDRKICSAIRISRPVITSIKVKLQEQGFIRYQTTNGTGTCYTILFVESVIESTSQKRVSKQKEKSGQKPKIRKQALKEPDQIIKAPTKENKAESPLLAIPEVRSITESEQEKNIEQNNKIPTWNEFLEFAETTETYLTDYEKQLKAKYEQWISKEWKDNLGNPITDWKKKLRSIMPYFGKNGDTGNFKTVTSLKKKIKE